MSGSLRDSSSEIVVYVVGYSEPAPEGEVAEVHQRDKQFVPSLLAVTAGQEVSFPNDEDQIVHNVFSVSPPNRIDLGTYRPGETRTTRLSTPGVLEFYCGLHPEMAMTVLVVPNRRHTTVAPDGSYVIEGVRAGIWSVFAYHRRAIKPTLREVTVVAGETVEVDFEVGQRFD